MQEFNLDVSSHVSIKLAMNMVIKWQKMVQNEKKLSGVLHISGTVHNMIFIYGAPV